MRCPVPVLVRVLDLHRAGRSYAEIARILTADGIAKPAGGIGWQRCHVWRLIRTRAALDMMLDDLEQPEAA